VADDERWIEANRNIPWQRDTLYSMTIRNLVGFSGLSPSS